MLKTWSLKDQKTQLEIVAEYQACADAGKHGPFHSGLCVNCSQAPTPDRECSKHGPFSGGVCANCGNRDNPILEFVTTAREKAAKA